MINELLSQAGTPWFNKLLYILAVASFTIIIANLIVILLKKSYQKSLELQEKAKKAGRSIPVINKTKFNVLRRIVVWTVYVGGILLIIAAFPELKNLSYSVFAGAGVLAIIIGFATQEVFSNIVAGIFISLFEPFRIDDRVKIGEENGYVEDITMWHTVIRTFNNQRLMIPNSVIAKETIVNYTVSDEKTLNFIDFGISYDSDIDLARKIILSEVEQSAYGIDNRREAEKTAGDPVYRVRVTSHGDFSIGLRLCAWTANAWDGFRLKSDLLESVKKRFDKEGVEIPFPYRTIVQKKDIPRPRRLRK